MKQEIKQLKRTQAMTNVWAIENASNQKSFRGVKGGTAIKLSNQIIVSQGCGQRLQRPSQWWRRREALRSGSPSTIWRRSLRENACDVPARWLWMSLFPIFRSLVIVVLRNFKQKRGEWLPAEVHEQLRSPVCSPCWPWHVIVLDEAQDLGGLRFREGWLEVTLLGEAE